ncbi:MAG: DUF4835 family protein [Bacteroidetes bacterium]|nr:DUF4835 family protein [Bacteroidota bacterium]
MKKLFFTLLLFPSLLQAQEIQSTVKVNVLKLQMADPRIFENLETALMEFINNRQWSRDEWLRHEKIECNFLLNITRELGDNKYMGTLTIQSSRPIFNSTYSSVLLSHVDRNITFRYTEYQPLEYAEGTHLNNLTSLFAFYINIILGLDYDSFSDQGGRGMRYYLKAQEIVNNAQSESNEQMSKGWKAFDGQTNRFWMVKYLMDVKFKAVRDAYFDYHYNGMDQMFNNPETARVPAGLFENVFVLENKRRTTVSTDSRTITLWYVPNLGPIKIHLHEEHAQSVGDTTWTLVDHNFPGFD